MLLDAAVEAAREQGYSVVWLTTTNDNLDAHPLLPAPRVPDPRGASGRSRPRA